MTTHIKPPFYLLILGAALALLLAGCASNERITDNEMTLLEQQVAQPTFKIECPADGCQFKSFSYKDPRDRVQMPDRPTNGWDFGVAAFRETTRMVSGAVPVLGTAAVGLSLGDNLLDLGVAGLESMQGHGETTHIDRSTEIGDYSGDSSGNSGTQGDYSGEQSGNSGTLNSDIPGRIESPGPIDESDRSDNSDNSTTDNSSRDNSTAGAPQ